MASAKQIAGFLVLTDHNFGRIIKAGIGIAILSLGLAIAWGAKLTKPK